VLGRPLLAPHDSTLNGSPSLPPNRADWSAPTVERQLHNPTIPPFKFFWF